MTKFTIKQYDAKDYSNWNAFISKAKNATFLFHRDFMGYHSDRFEDYSLLVYDKQNLVAVLPANRVEGTVFSHQGLSYGGLLIKKSIRILDYILIFRSLMEFLNSHNIKFLELKSLPKIYNKTIADEIDYLSFLMKATLFRTDVYLTIDNQEEYTPNRNRTRALKIAAELAIIVKEEADYDSFWNQILSPNLKNRFNVAPVHSNEEIKKLSLLFPKNIKLFNAYEKDKLKAGVLMFLTADVAHFQYSSGGNDRNDTAALDILFDYIIKKYANKKYISFGSSSENDGLKLNEGLAYWKESFGAKTTVQSFLRFETSNYKLLDNVVS